MKNFLQRTIIVALLFISYTAAAQNTGSATGKVLNGKDKSPVDYASVAVKRLSDSVTVGGTNTTQTGTFTVSGLAPGKYKLYVVYIGLKSINQEFEITAAAPSKNFGNLTMEDTGVTLKGVTIQGEIPPVVVKKDTLEFDAKTIKVKENAVVEDLLKKVPGVEVSKDGTVTTQGETIKRVKVDGKDFMGSDPLLATRNLPADMVDKIQIIDDMSDQAKFSGVDDGNREKIINITTKNGVKNKGFVGNNTVGYGTDDRYDVNLSVTRFDENQRITLLGQFNNVNKQNFGGGVGGGGGGRGMQFSTGGGQQSGITTTNAGGIDFADTYKNGTQVNGSYFFNKTSLFNTNNTFSQTFLGSNTNTNRSDLNSTTERLNHRLNFTIDTKIDSSTSIRLQPSFSYSDNEGNSVQNYNRMSIRGNAVGKQTLNTNSKSPSFSNSMLIRKKFVRRGRTLSLNVNTSYNSADADNYNLNPEILTSPTNVVSDQSLNQLIDNDTKAFNSTARLVYTEPLSKTLSLELNYQNGFAYDNKERYTYDFNSITQQYDVVDLDYSNKFENKTLTNGVGFSFNKNEKKYNWNIGLGLQQTHRENENLTKSTSFTQNFVNLTPSATFRYNFSTTKRLNIRYDGRTNQPTIDQIQPIADNSNTVSVPIGNPNLKPSFSNTLRVFYNNFDFKSYRTLFIGAFLTQTFNAFGNDQSLILTGDNAGKIANGYANVDGNFNANLFGNVGLPLIKGNKLTLQINASSSYAKSTNISEGKENITKELSASNGYKLVSNLDKLDLIAGITGTVTRATYTIGNNTRFYKLAPNIDISYLFPGNIRLQTDVTYNRQTGGGAGYDTDFTTVNGYISRQFFNNRGTFKLSVNDMFNQNTGITRSTGGNSITDQNFNVLKRYYMFSFTFSLSKIAGVSTGGQGGQRQGMGGMRMGGM
ncbi:outer membrane beta-barrel family protein [Pedobacter frigiditerrae]|uniref:outer membrane beta-barrel family protein n=1 Tax=Pedobacter frigiditerrae TaxID=2530452 RepID=UPI00292EEB13|nr:outer membrane beta-barrel family protein [Pedobacter frigiditerrae]